METTNCKTCRTLIWECHTVRGNCYLCEITQLREKNKKLREENKELKKTIVALKTKPKSRVLRRDRVEPEQKKLF